MLAEQLVGEARARRPHRITQIERAVLGASSACFLVAATLIAVFVESQRDVDPFVALGLVAAYGLISRVRFEFGNGYVVPEQLTFVPLLFLAPLELVPFLVAAGAVIAYVPDIVRGRTHRDRWLSSLADAWWTVGPVLVLVAFAPGPPELGLVGIYLLAFGAQVVGDLAWSLVRNRFVDQMSARETIETWAGTVRVD